MSNAIEMRDGSNMKAAAISQFLGLRSGEAPVDLQAEKENIKGLGLLAITLAGLLVVHSLLRPGSMHPGNTIPLSQWRNQPGDAFQQVMGISPNIKGPPIYFSPKLLPDLHIQSQQDQP